MPIIIVCRSCSSKLKVPDNLAGRKAKCSKCGSIVQVSSPASPAMALSSNPAKQGSPARPKPSRDDDYEIVDEPPKKKKTAPVPQDDYEVVDDAPPKKKKASPAPADDFEVVEDEAPKKKKRLPPDDPKEEPPQDDLPLDEPKKKKKKKRRRQDDDEDAGTPSWVWWAASVAGVMLLLAVGGLIGIRAGHKEDVVFYATWLAFSIPVSMVILFVSMILSSMLGGGINFGEVRLAILKLMLLLLIVNPICLIEHVGVYLAFPVWLLGLMYCFDLDLWEAKFLVVINWMLNWIVNVLLIVMFVGMVLHGKLGDHGGGLDFGDESRQPATQQEKTAKWIDDVGGEYTDDESADDLVIISVKLAGTKIGDSDLPKLKSLPRLMTLDLRNTPITDQGLTHLKGITTLRFIDLKDTKVTPKGVDDLKKSLPSAQVGR